MTAEPVAPPPDDKDWTWVLNQPCPECGFDATTVTDVPGLTRDSATALVTALARPDAATRPSPDVWSPLEYACHVRDVCRRFDERLHRMLAEDDPVFANWDQDATALEDRYWEQDPAVVGRELREASERIADSFAAVRDDQWSRPSRRSNGSVFTVHTFSRYFAHDLVHHVHDVTG
jgi:hypothetical protein